MYYSKTIRNSEAAQFCLMLQATIDAVTDYKEVISCVIDDSFAVIEQRKEIYEISSGYYDLVLSLSNNLKRDEIELFRVGKLRDDDLKKILEIIRNI